MADEPQFTVRASDPGASKALRTIAANVRVTNPSRAQEIEEHAQAFDAYAARRRPGAGFVPKR